MNVFIRGAEVAGQILDVRIRAGVIAELDCGLAPRPDEELVVANSGALIAGLHDHHIHLLAAAAAADSVDCGPPRVRTAMELGQTLGAVAARLPKGRWIRGVNYHESVAGALDREFIDRIVSDRPVRIQHRGGALWTLNSAGLAALGASLDSDADVERDAAGHPTGRLWRFDARLRAAVGTAVPDLAALGARLIAFGITSVTDATPDEDGSGQITLGAAVRDRRLPIGVHVMSAQAAAQPVPELEAGPRKLLLRDHDLPNLDDLAESIDYVHKAGRAVAIHCVTRQSLVLTLAALRATGTIGGDRIEHAAVVPPETRRDLANMSLAVVTQPSFVTERGDQYLASVDDEDRELLYPYASLLAAGVRVAPSSDAPFGEIDPWRTIRSAVHRTTRSGTRVVAAERVSARIALAGFLSSPGDPGGPPRRLQVGSPADVCLLTEPLAVALTHPDAELVRVVIRAGNVVFRRL
ncbi:putative amidohydrolase YtcJ [Nocardia kruczakiae]|uniref:Amidohydrolase YtcJ n=1 Tax=Nocardia kruczakiae TaxID=261477 RepID=A0ABU1X9R9_9NOCA|nr:amidohydrolase family protein [Nocardia kruczakiae]MDR7167286.1 putative amidohydrolase YtcJ [Nocardia kruczakiae]